MHDKNPSALAARWSDSRDKLGQLKREYLEHDKATNQLMTELLAVNGIFPGRLVSMDGEDTQYAIKRVRVRGNSIIYDVQQFAKPKSAIIEAHKQLFAIDGKPLPRICHQFIEDFQSV